MKTQAWACNTLNLPHCGIQDEKPVQKKVDRCGTAGAHKDAIYYVY